MLGRFRLRDSYPWQTGELVAKAIDEPRGTGSGRTRLPVFFFLGDVMKIYAIFGDRGANPPELLEAIDEFSHEENPRWIDAMLSHHRSLDDHENVQVICFSVNQEQIESLLRPEETAVIASFFPEDGDWFYRGSYDEWWRLAHVSNGKVTGGWIATDMDVANFSEGEWRRPVGDEVEIAKKDVMGRLLNRE